MKRSIRAQTAERRRVFGFDFVVNHDRTHASLIDEMFSHVDADGRRCAASVHGAPDALPLVVTPNVDLLVKLDRPDWQEDADTFSRAAYVVADGAPVVAVANALGHGIGVRTPGSDLFPLMWARCRADHLPVTVVCPTELVAERLQQENADARVIVAPRVDSSDPEAIAAFADEVAALARRGQPSPLVVFSIGNPTQTRLARHLLDTWPEGVDQPLVCCFGASAEMYLGIVPRAPVALQRVGLEWFYRFAREPRRLLRRYFVDDLAFVKLAWREYRTTAR